MGIQQKWRPGVCIFFGRIVPVLLAVLTVLPGGLRAQSVYFSTPGRSTIAGEFDPHNPIPRAPGPPITGTQPAMPTIPADQYAARKAIMAQHSQSSFPLPPVVQLSSPVIPRAPGGVIAPPIVQAPTLSWQGIQLPSSSQFNPPSPDIAVGPSDVLMVVNATIAQFTKSGTLKTQTSFQEWFSSVIGIACPSGGCLLFDPCIRYDQLHGRFIFLATSRTGDLRTSYLLVSVSNGATYDSGWKIWALDAGLDGATQTGYWGDFWRFGFDNVAVYLSGNMYDRSSAFKGAKIRVLKKSELYNPATTTLNWKDVSGLMNEDGTPADSLTAVHQRGTPAALNAGLLVNSTTFNVPASFLTVWKVADPLADQLVVTRNTIRGLWPYDFPAPAPQLGTSITLDAGDSRMLKAIYRSGFLYTARDTGYADQATTVTFDVVDTTTMQLSSQARLINTNSFYPAFDVPASAGLGVPFALTSVVAGTTTAPDGSLTYAGISRLKNGEGPFSQPGNPNRWGDYFGGAVDPVSGGLWTGGAYAKPTFNGLGVWGTWAGYFPWLTSSSFTDVPAASPFFDYVNVFSLWQITTGCSSAPAKYCPTDLVNRAQLATFLIRSMYGNNFTYTLTPYFTDVPASSVFFPYIQKMRDLGITTGCSATTFCPGDPVSRSDAAIFIVRGKFKALFGDNFSYPTTPNFTDVPANSAAFRFVQKMYELGITSGCGTNLFCPQGLLTRQEIAVFVTRAFLN